MIGNSGVPSGLTPDVNERMSSPSVHAPMPAGVMFLLNKERMGVSGSPNCPPPLPSLPFTTGQYLVKSRSAWHSVQPVT